MLNQRMNKSRYRGVQLRQSAQRCAGKILNRVKGSNAQTTVGVSLPEMLVAVVMVGILARLAAPSITYGEGNPADQAATQIQATLRTLRTLAISNTSAYRMTWSSGSKTLTTQYVNSTDCTSTTGWKSAGMFSTSELTLPAKASITSPTSISICFDSQGFASQDLTISIKDARYSTSTRTRTVQAYLGGAIDAY
jgi:Tfp pilus assembly protein FimT